jgi:PAS domain S-box-containing protein
MLGGYAHCKLIFEQNRAQDFIYLNVNAAFEKLTGLKDVVGKKVTEVMPDIFKSHPELLETYARVAMTGKPEKFEVYLAPIEAWLSITVYSNEEECFVAIFNNITDRKRSEEVLRESEERFRLLVEHAPDAIYIQTDSRFSYVNQASVALFGAKDEGDLLGLPIMERIHPDFQEIVLKRIETNNHARQKVPNLEELYLRLDGTVVDVEASAVPFDFHGEHGALVFVRDITERKRAEEELQKKNAEIEQFVYTTSHDLRTPLVTVKTFLGFLESDMAGNNQERVSQDLQFIHSAADKMKLMLDELLELSRIDRIETPSVRVSFSEVLTEVLDALAGVIAERKVDIRLSDTDLILFGDRSRLCQIWQNLIENAIKYSGDDGIPRIELGVQQESGETVFFVKDDGIGIDPQYHSKIFKIFEKLDQKSPGAGMGLSMIQRIVEKCGGRVWAESEGTDKGSCFFFTLPHVVVQS